MRFEEVERTEYEHNILFEVLLQARFPDIMKISQGLPIDFQDVIRKEGYPEFVSDFPVLPTGIPRELDEISNTDKVYHFLSEDKDWKFSLAKDFVAFTCSGSYKNYEGYRNRLDRVLHIFNETYEPSYFTRIGLRHKNVANKVSLPHIKNYITSFIPEYIFPELTMSIEKDIETLQKVSQFNDGEVKATVAHVLSQVSGRFNKKQFSNEQSYVVDIDCYSESKTESVEDVLTKCDLFKRLNWNIFQWSITDTLRRAMGNSST